MLLVDRSDYSFRVPSCPCPACVVSPNLVPIGIYILFIKTEGLRDLGNHRLKPILSQGQTHPIKGAEINCGQKWPKIINHHATFTKTVSKSQIHLVGNKELKEWLSIEMKKNGWRRKNRNSKSESVKWDLSHILFLKYVLEISKSII